MDARRQFIRRVERAHAALAVAVVLAAMVMWALPVWSGVLLGVLFGGLNFRVWAILAAKLTRASDSAGRASAMGLIVVKMVTLLGTIAAVMILAEPDGRAFLAGISVAPASLVLVSALAGPTFEDEPAAVPSASPAGLGAGTEAQ